MSQKISFPRIGSKSQVSETFFSSLRRFLSENALNLFGIGISIYLIYVLNKRFRLLGSTSNEEQKRLESLLRDLQKRQERSKQLILNSWERVIANDIIMPSEINVTFEDIGGLEEAKALLFETVIAPFTHPELFKRGRLSVAPKGILLCGPPGTGKTMLAKSLAKQAKCSFINVQFGVLFQKWLGDSEKVITAIFTLAEKIQPCIIFIDEIDSLFRKRNDLDHEVTARVKALFLSLWDGLKTDQQAITIVGATNRPAVLDEAFQRRMPYTFQIPLPDVRQREAILRIILKDEPYESSLDFKKLAEETERYSGSDLYALCQTASRVAIKEYLRDNIQIQSTDLKPLRKIQYEDFVEAKKTVLPTGEAASNYQPSTHQGGEPGNGSQINFNFLVLRP